MKKVDKFKNKKTFTSLELGQLLTAKGFTLDRIKGDHKIYVRDGTTVVVNVCNLNRMVAMRIIKENHLLDDDPEVESENIN